MTVKRDECKDLDGLLKKALADDLPVDVEAGMRESIRNFRARTTKGETLTPAWSWLSRRSAWAALSVLLLIAGILLQGLGSGSPLADRIAHIKAESTLQTIGR
jgi:hypothetical protein